MNEEFQRIAKRDKKAFLSDQCKEIEENNRMGKTRDLFKKIRDTKGTFHAKKGSIKEINGMGLTEIIRCLLLGRKVMTNLDSILKSRGITLPRNIHPLKAMVFKIVMYECES